MNTKTKVIAIWLAAFFSAWSGGKDDNGPSGNNGGANGNLAGKRIYSFTGSVYQLDLKTNQQSIYFTFNTYGFNNCDMSWDEQFSLTSEREGGVFDVAKITLVRNADGAIVDEFDYDSP